MPDDIREIGQLVRQNIIHRTTLAAGNTDTNADLRFGDMTKVPWWRQPEDDILPTAAAMLAELYRRDERGFVADRDEGNKLVLTCRFVAILMATILKSKGIPARVRAGNASYFEEHEQYGKVSWDHWITQAWTKPSRIKQRAKYRVGYYPPAMRVIRQTSRGKLPSLLGLFSKKR